MPVIPTAVSVIEPLTPAFKRIKTILFAPFDLKKWFIIGFCAWLSSCGETGGGTGGGGGSGRKSNSGSNVREDIQHGLAQAKDYVLENLAWIIPVVILVMALGVALWLLALWLNSRGKFMLLHCVALNRAEIQIPWDKFAQHAHSLFLFRIVLGAAAFLIIAPLVTGSCAVLLVALANEGPIAGAIVVLVLGVLCAIAVGIGFAIIKKLLVDFVVPIMYLRTVSVLAAWREFRALASENLVRFLWYLLFSVLLSIMIHTAIFIVVIATCCTAGCVMAIPYIGTVLLLPVYVFSRSYSLYYFQQYGDEFQLIDPNEPLAALPGVE